MKVVNNSLPNHNNQGMTRQCFGSHKVLPLGGFRSALKANAKAKAGIADFWLIAS